MKYSCKGLILSLFLALFSNVAKADSQQIVFDAPLIPIAIKDLVNERDGTIDSISNAGTLCDKLATITEGHVVTGVTPCLIQVIRWSEPDPTSHLQSVQPQHWYVYSDPKNSWEDFTSRNRLMGVQEAYLFYIHINRASGTVNDYTPHYKVVITKKVSVNVQHLFQLLQAFSGGATKAIPGPGAEASPDAEFGGGHIDIQFRPSDIVVTSEAFRSASNNTTPPSAPLKLADDITFDNEGKYYFDFSLAVPVRRISEIKYDSTGGTFTPANFGSTNVFAMVDLFLPAADVKSSNWTVYPHPVVGFAFAKQPLSKILVAGAWGPHFAEIFIGATFVKQPRTAAGSNSCTNSGTATATPTPFGYHYCAEFSIGLNLPVTGFVSKLSAPK
jgi:hypothetical protein